MKFLCRFAAVGLSLATATAQQQPTTSQSPRDSVFSATIGPYKVVARTPPSSKTAITIETNGGRRIAVEGQLFGLYPNDAALFERSRLIVYNNLSGSVAIIDPARGRVIDYFQTSGASISPSARFIAFRPRTPRWRDESALYLLYDIAAAPSANRMVTQDTGPPGIWDTSNTDLFSGFSKDAWVVGWPVYPDPNRTNHTYTRSFVENEVGGPGTRTTTLGPWHEQWSALQWLSDHELAFVDSQSSEGLILVASDLSSGIRSPVVWTAKIDPQAMLDPMTAPPNVKAGSKRFLYWLDLSLVSATNERMTFAVDPGNREPWLRSTQVVVLKSASPSPTTPQR